MDKSSIKNLEELIDSVSDIDGFPLGNQKDIIGLSDPPFYTACPNPYITEFINLYGNVKIENYVKKPFLRDVHQGKNELIYNLHSYPTKVPPKAIEQYIIHYTKPGDIILDGYCGTGMTGIAARRQDRYCVLLDLSPLASFIAYNLTTPFDHKLFLEKGAEIIKEVKEECGWMYKTNHSGDSTDGKHKFKQVVSDIDKEGEIIYIVWSDMYICPYCGFEYVLWHAALDKTKNKISNKFNCPKCNIEITKDECEKSTENIYDYGIGIEIIKTKQTPIFINYKVNNKRFIKKPDKYDLKIIEEIKNKEIPYWYPTEKMMFKGYQWGDSWRRGYHLGITNVHHFYTKRNLWILAAIRERIEKIQNKCLKNILLCWFTSSQSRLHRMNRYIKKHNRHVGPYSGTLYISPFQTEISPFYFLMYKFEKFRELRNKISDGSIVSTQSITDLSNIPDKCIDYIFVDPPFGDNLMYSELNFMIESWLKVYENTKKEAIISKSQQKSLNEYTNLITLGFKELYRVLKPNRWITIEFHNSNASVWNGIQEALNRAHFIIAQVSILDKKKGTVKQLISPGTVKSDLIINAYKPKQEFEEKFLESAGLNMELEFIIQQLDHLPIQANLERTEKMLYSRMLAHYIENGYKIKYDSTNFYNLISDNFIEINGYWFLNEQVKKYNEWKSSLNLNQIKKIREGHQFLFIDDESSAVSWLSIFLNKPKKFNEIYTAYNQLSIKSNDEIPELKELLIKNFFFENKEYRRPKNKIEVEKINKIKERDLESEFNKLLKQIEGQKTKLKSLRKEALIYGLTKLYQNNEYDEIIRIGNKITKKALESSGDIMDFVDIAKIKTEGASN